MLYFSDIKREENYMRKFPKLSADNMEKYSEPMKHGKTEIDLYFIETHQKYKKKNTDFL